jgi:hypothetical protein
MTKHGAQTSAFRSDGQGLEERTAEAHTAAASCESEAEQEATDAAEDDTFDEVPTVANRRRPTLPKVELPPAEKTPGIGAYRMLHPATSDDLTPRPATKLKPGARVVIGVTRK